MARPKKYTQKLKKEMLNEFREYVKNNDFPSVAEFSSITLIPKTNFYDWSKEKGLEEFSTLIKICNSKQEAWALRAGRDGVIKATFPIFILKNHGYTDKQEIVQTVNGNMNIEHGISKETRDAMITDKDLLKEIMSELKDHEEE